MQWILEKSHTSMKRCIKVRVTCSNHKYLKLHSAILALIFSEINVTKVNMWVASNIKPFSPLHWALHISLVFMFKHVDIPYKNFYWLMFLYVTVNSRSSSCTDMRMCVRASGEGVNRSGTRKTLLSIFTLLKYRRVPSLFTYVLNLHLHVVNPFYSKFWLG